MASDSDFVFAQDLIRRAGEQMRAGLSRGYKTVWKPDNTPVTDVDISVNAYVNDALHAAYPDDRVLGEEAGLDGKSGFTWVVDPIDGTQALGLMSTSTVCIARTDQDGQPLFGLVYNPVTDELFAAARGEESTLNGQALRVSAETTIKGSYIFFGSGMPGTVASNGIVYDRLEGQGGKIFNARSLAYSCVMVAAGKAEGAFIGVDAPYEAAAVKLIVEGAGGKVTDLLGNEPGRLDGEIQGLIVSNGHIHDALLAAVQKS